MNNLSNNSFEKYFFRFNYYLLIKLKHIWIRKKTFFICLLIGTCFDLQNMYLKKPSNIPSAYNSNTIILLQKRFQIHSIEPIQKKYRIKIKRKKKYKFKSIIAELYQLFDNI